MLAHTDAMSRAGRQGVHSDVTDCLHSLSGPPEEFAQLVSQ